MNHLWWSGYLPLHAVQYVFLPMILRFSHWELTVHIAMLIVISLSFVGDCRLFCTVQGGNITRNGNCQPCPQSSKWCNLICQPIFWFFSSGIIPGEFVPNAASPSSVTAHESTSECCMIKPPQGHDLLSFLKLLLTVLQALPPSGLAPLSPGSVCRCFVVTSLTFPI